MMEVLTALIDRLAEPRALTWLFLAFVALTSLFPAVQPTVDRDKLPDRVRQDEDALARWLENPALDGRPFYRPSDVHAVIDSYESHRDRQVYAARELTLDLAYPLVYALFGTAALTFLFGGFAESWPSLYALRWLPCWMAAFDVVENLTFATMLLAHRADRPLVTLAWVARIASSGKWLLAGASLLLLVLGVVYALYTLGRRLLQPAT